MIENTSRLQELLGHYLSGKVLTEIEESELWGYVNDPLYAWKLEELLGAYFQGQTGEYSLTVYQQQEILERVFEIKNRKQGRVKHMFRWPAIAAGVAAIVIMALFGVYWFREASAPSLKNTTPVVAVADIAPGKVGATLTLANGEKIRLADVKNGQVVEEGDIRIVKTKEGQLVYEIKPGAGAVDGVNSLSTAPGETYHVILPDQSKVWMNADSRLAYHAGLYHNGLRKLSLEGEAYFEIAKDSKHPFVVETGGQQVEVLGTHFNISAYKGENIRTTLLEGSVKIAAGNEAQKIIKPGQQSELTSGKIQVRTVQVEDIIAWKNGFFSFDNENLQAVMTKIGRWYNVEVEFDDKALRQETFYGSISRFENISTVLKSLERTGIVSFQVKSNRVIVRKK